MHRSTVQQLHFVILGGSIHRILVASYPTRSLDQIRYLSNARTKSPKDATPRLDAVPLFEPLHSSGRYVSLRLGSLCFAARTRPGRLVNK